VLTCQQEVVPVGHFVHIHIDVLYLLLEIFTQLVSYFYMVLRAFQNAHISFIRLLLPTQDLGGFQFGD
jgi:hypothetical protein